MKKNSAKFIFAFPFLIFLLSACEPENQPSIDSIAEELRSTLSKAKEAVKGLEPVGSDVQNSAKEEVAKLFVFEYRVLNFSKSTPTSEIELEMNKMGKEMWECFDVVPMKDSVQIFCKRRPKTPLRFIPKVF